MRHYEYLLKAKYHQEISQRLLQGYKETENKTFLAAYIRELARSTYTTILATLEYNNKKIKKPEQNVQLYITKIGPKYLDKHTLQETKKILELAKTQKKSPIEFTKKGTIILLINGNYKILTPKRLEELKETNKKILQTTTKIFRQV